MVFESLKVYETDKTSENKEKSQKLLSSIYSLLDKATKKNIFHKTSLKPSHKMKIPI